MKTYINTPLGIIEVKGTDTYITSVLFVENEDTSDKNLPVIINECVKQLQEYFEGKRTDFSLQLAPEGTPFQQEVWSELQKIKYGDTATYGHIAKALRDENASQAVGAANGKNPIAVIIPCHRVIGHDGKLTGYAGGMWRKSWLLEHEGNVSGKNPTLF